VDVPKAGLQCGIPCPKSYAHEGKKCVPCADYYDEKITKYPQLLLTPEDCQVFRKDLREFEIVFDEKKGKELNCAGTINALKPRFIMNRHHERAQVWFQESFLVFQEVFIDITLFEDTVYAILSPSQQSLGVNKGDQLEFRVALRLDRGRLILDRVYGIEIEKKSTAKHWIVAETRQALLLEKNYFV